MEGIEKGNGRDNLRAIAVWQFRVRSARKLSPTTPAKKKSCATTCGRVAVRERFRQKKKVLRPDHSPPDPGIAFPILYAHICAYTLLNILPLA